METRLPKRKRVRLAAYEYSRPGYYYFTVCTLGRVHCLSRVEPEGLTLLPAGAIVQEELSALETRYPRLSVDKAVIMPNHVHMILRLREGDGPEVEVLRALGAFKSLSARRAAPGRRLWQGGCYDRVIRDRAEYLRIWKYIDDNPAKWADDPYNGPTEPPHQH